MSMKVSHPARHGGWLDGRTDRRTDGRTGGYSAGLGQWCGSVWRSSWLWNRFLCCTRSYHIHETREDHRSEDTFTSWDKHTSQSEPLVTNWSSAEITGVFCVMWPTTKLLSLGFEVSVMPSLISFFLSDTLSRGSFAEKKKRDRSCDFHAVTQPWSKAPPSPSESQNKVRSRQWMCECVRWQCCSPRWRRLQPADFLLSRGHLNTSPVCFCPVDSKGAPTRSLEDIKTS